MRMRNRSQDGQRYFRLSRISFWRARIVGLGNGYNEDHVEAYFRFEQSALADRSQLSHELACLVSRRSAFDIVTKPLGINLNILSLVQ